MFSNEAILLIASLECLVFGIYSGQTGDYSLAIFATIAVLAIFAFAKYCKRKGL